MLFVKYWGKNKILLDFEAPGCSEICTRPALSLGLNMEMQANKILRLEKRLNVSAKANVLETVAT